MVFGFLHGPTPTCRIHLDCEKAVIALCRLGDAAAKASAAPWSTVKHNGLEARFQNHGLQALFGSSSTIKYNGVELSPDLRIINCRPSLGAGTM